MIVLHTSDWHLGKRLMERDRLAEQSEALDELVKICEDEGVDLVLIAGDVFDTYLPSAEAEELFYRAVKALAGENRAVVAISGNHDDGVRLSAAAELAEEHGIYLFGNRPRTVKTGGTRAVKAVEAGENWLIVENAEGERVYLNILPYPNEARLREERTDESFSEKMTRWISRGESGYRGDTAHIFLSHLFVAGGRMSESERDIDLGGARAVPLRCLPQDGYCALGHLHRPQTIGGACYSGSLLQYSFDEANTEKSVRILRIAGKEISASELPLRAGKRLVRLQCRGIEEALALLPRYEGNYIELTLYLDAPLTTADTEALRACNPGLVSLIAQIKQSEREEIVCRSALKPEELFSEFYRSQFGDEPSQALKTAFLGLLEEES